ncbi:MAG: Abi family protein [bacterium]
MAGKYDKQRFISKIISQLSLDSERGLQIGEFLETVPYYRLTPYIELLTSNSQAVEFLYRLSQDFKDKWDMVVYLYRYNIKLSTAIYPYIYLFETTLKNKINNYLCSTIGYDWISSEQLFYTFKDKDKRDLLKVISSYRYDNKTFDNMYFVDNYTTLGFWTLLIKNKSLWDGKNIKLKDIFINDADYLQVKNKLESVRKLRNDISHHNRIIGLTILRRETSSGKINYKLKDIYSNIIDLFQVMNCQKLSWMLGDLHCAAEDFCDGNSFEVLYDKLEFILKLNCKSQI